ncbi:hypothetical protein TSACC_21758 [Terrimicrobium sacchariphilum]|uniref:Uncharacterized protein n=1 Tax=Terrimicrobium sacchariphilum TaxID=690879 RepID=A0A146G7L7_TERSA|nr:hypothetical protein TSACC_21758 [Terrimicrobium sacchariphilum]
MNPSFAPRLPLEVFHNIGEIALQLGDPGISKSPEKQLTSRTDEGFAPLILLISRLLSDEDPSRIAASSAKDRLRRIPPEQATLTIPGR